MKINQFYILWFLCRFVAAQIYYDDEPKKVDRKCNETLKMEFKRRVTHLGRHNCLKGKMILTDSDEYKITQVPRTTKCDTLAPKCGFKAKRTWLRTDKIVDRHYIHFGCFPAHELQMSNLKEHKNIQTIPFKDVHQLIDYLFWKHAHLEDIFKNISDQELESNGYAYSFQDVWVENPSEFIFNRKNETYQKTESFFYEFLGGTEFSPIMLVYIVFICFSVIFKVSWLVSIAWKTMKRGYEPVKVKERKNTAEETVEELD